MLRAKQVVAVVVGLYLAQLMTACSSKETLTAELEGSWEGFNRADGVSWCFEFNPDGELLLTTLQKLPIDDWSADDWHTRARLVQFEGGWQVADGRRIVMTAAPEDVKNVHRSLGASQIPALAMTHILIVTDIDDSSWTASRDNREFVGMSSERVEACPSYYSIGEQDKVLVPGQQSAEIEPATEET